MAEKTGFTKLQGAGNGDIYVNTLRYNISVPDTTTAAWNHRHTVVDGDVLILVGKPDAAEAGRNLHVFNADGSEAMLFGNERYCV